MQRVGQLNAWTTWEQGRAAHCMQLADPSAMARGCDRKVLEQPASVLGLLAHRTRSGRTPRARSSSPGFPLHLLA